MTDNANLDHPLVGSDRIENTTVYDSSGNQIGVIRRLVIEKVSGQVVYAETTFGGFLGVGSESHTIPWDRLQYDVELGGYKTTITEEQLRTAPEFSRGDASLLSGEQRRLLGDHYLYMADL